MTKDFLGNDIQVDDIVTELQYRNFIFAKILKITPKMLFLTQCSQNRKVLNNADWAISKQSHDQCILFKKAKEH